MVSDQKRWLASPECALEHAPSSGGSAILAGLLREFKKWQQALKGFGPDSFDVQKIRRLLEGPGFNDPVGGHLADSWKQHELVSRRAVRVEADQWQSESSS